MHDQRPLVIVDDDRDDQELMQVALGNLGFNHEIKFFSDAESALHYLYETDARPFLIVSDVNMPKMDGIAFKRKIDSCEVLRAKCIPFIFLSTSTKFLDQICDISVQGYFEKGTSWRELEETIKIILQYWKRTHHQHIN